MVLKSSLLLRKRYFSTQNLQRQHHRWNIKQIKKSNFNDSLEDIKDHVSVSDFIAVSLHNTGSFSSPWHRFSAFDTADIAYLKSKFAAERFQILQFAVCPFRIEATKVIAYPLVIFWNLPFLFWFWIANLFMIFFGCLAFGEGIIFTCSQGMNWRWECHRTVLRVKIRIWLPWLNKVLISMLAFTKVSLVFSVISDAFFFGWWKYLADEINRLLDWFFCSYNLIFCYFRGYMLWHQSGLVSLFHFLALEKFCTYSFFHSLMIDRPIVPIQSARVCCKSSNGKSSSLWFCNKVLYSPCPLCCWYSIYRKDQITCQALERCM